MRINWQQFLTARFPRPETCSHKNLKLKTRKMTKKHVPVNPPRLDEIRAAQERLKGIIVRAPLLQLNSPKKTGVILMKPEVLQPAKSFKIRGVYNWAASLASDERKKGFSTFSAGNTARSLGYAAQIFGVPCRSILPDHAPADKVEALHSLGVETILVPFKEMFQWVDSEGWKRESYAFLHPWTEPKMIAGHGTIGLEIIEDQPDIQTVFVPVGGGALISGIGAAIKALKPSVRIIAVQTESYPSLKASFQAGKPVSINPKPTICYGVAVPFVYEPMYPLLQKIVDDVLTVSEEKVKTAIKQLMLDNRLVVEGAGALSVAAALEMPEERRGKTACIISGGSIGKEALSAILSEI